MDIVYFFQLAVCLAKDNVKNLICCENHSNGLILTAIVHSPKTLSHPLQLSNSSVCFHISGNEAFQASYNAE